MNNGKLNVDFSGDSLVMKSGKFDSITLVADTIGFNNGKLELGGADPKIVCQNIYSDKNTEYNGTIICPLTLENIFLIDMIEKIKHNKVENKALINAWQKFELILKLCKDEKPIK